MARTWQQWMTDVKSANETKIAVAAKATKVLSSGGVGTAAEVKDVKTSWKAAQALNPALPDLEADDFQTDVIRQKLTSVLQNIENLAAKLEDGDYLVPGVRQSALAEYALEADRLAGVIEHLTEGV